MRKKTRYQLIFALLVVTLITFLIILVIAILPSGKVVDPHTLVDSNLILFDNQVAVSFDKKYIAFLTTKDLGMRDSVIWISKSSGKDLTKLAFDETPSENNHWDWVSNPIFDPKGSKIAYLRINPMQIWTINIDGTDKRLIFDGKELYPPVGYGGKTYFEWNENGEVVFENSAYFPSKYFAVDTYTGEIREIASGGALPDSYTVMNVPLFYQRSNGYRDIQLGSCKDQSIYSAGCAISSIAMVLKYYRIDVTPESLNAMLAVNEDEGYDSGCDVRWDIAANYSPGIELSAVYHYDPKEVLLNRLNKELDAGNPVIIGMDNPKHFVVATRRVGSTYYINDPWYEDGDTKTLDLYGNEFQHLIIYKKV